MMTLYELINTENIFEKNKKVIVYNDCVVLELTRDVLRQYKDIGGYDIISIQEFDKEIIIKIVKVRR